VFDQSARLIGVSPVRGEIDGRGATHVPGARGGLMRAPPFRQGRQPRRSGRSSSVPLRSRRACGVKLKRPFRPPAGGRPRTRRRSCARLSRAWKGQAASPSGSACLTLARCVPSGRRRSGVGCTTAGTVGSQPTQSGLAARRVHRVFPGHKPRRSGRPETPSSRRARVARERQGSAAAETRLGLVVWSSQSSSSPSMPLACHIRRTSSVTSGHHGHLQSHR
jgi:hypothetical protein